MKTEMGFGILKGVLIGLILFITLVKPALGSTRRYNFEIKLQKVNRLCQEKSIVTVNGQFPGPQITAVEGDRLIITVINHVEYNVTIHWHGIRQVRSAWADGTAYITQCPIQTGQKFVYDFSTEGHTGTLFWHAHITWLRVTLYGPLIILPKKNVPYPFPKPYGEVPILLGEWWKSDTEASLAHVLHTGGGPEVSDAFTINGLPGISNACSDKDAYKLRVEPGKTYLLRLINGALNSDFFFGIANHTLTVVEADAVYTKQFETDIIVISPGQTTNVLLKTKQYYPNASFLIVAKPHPFGRVEFNGNSTAGILQYGQPKSTLPLLSPEMPDYFDYDYANNYCSKLRSLSEVKVAKKVDKYYFFTVGLGVNECPEDQTCQGLLGGKMAGPINNVTFLHPKTALLEAHYSNKSEGVYTTDFPENPPFEFNYTGNPPSNISMATRETRLVELAYGTSVQVVIQGTSVVTPETHPFHLHGFDFYVVGRGLGNFDPIKDTPMFNLVDPSKRNTVNMAPGGWVAIRFVADNPGVWLMHCHLEIHSSWGMEMAWVVRDGERQDQKLPPPPLDLPKC
ncbi:oxidase [Lithospermum erythrorhizon]|uniref:Laccase n=1 Tax=Lithospermum erythrorhizon TaxID=34254 RepID=A0AAV3P0D3_LITER